MEVIITGELPRDLDVYFCVTLLALPGALIGL
jgi:hypothetical protein